MPEESYAGKTCIVTGGASFIGSHLVDRLVDASARVIVIDDFSSGRRENLAAHRDSAAVEIRECDLSNSDAAAGAFSDADVVFHLAAIHGGRGFIEAFPEKMLVNFAIDQNVIACASRLEVDALIQASSACAYPISLQSDLDRRSKLAEPMAGFDHPEQSFPDGTYGWLKLMGEYQVKVAAEAGRFRGRSARIFTAYGERENESHAAVALIAKALLQADPFPIWGTGLQTRNFTYVGDTVQGLLLLGSDASEPAYDVYNIGSDTHHTINEFIEVIFDAVGWRPSVVQRQTQFPTGVGNRASDNSKILGAYGWEPRVGLEEGVSKTLQWYRDKESRPKSMVDLEKLLLER